jgi:hypothetical protein
MTIASLWNPITDIGRSAADSVFGALWTEIGNGAEAVTTALWTAITASTDISFTSVAWTGSSTQALLRVVLQLSAAVMLLMVFLAVIRAVVKGDPAAAARAVLVDLPISCIGALALVGLTAALVAATDQAADSIMRLAPSDALSSFAHNWPALITNLQFVGGFGGLLFILGAFAVWLELIVRAGLIYLMVATGPLVLAMRIFPGFAPAWKKFAETAVAVILAKVFVAIALVLGLSLTTGGLIPTGTAAGTGQDMGQLLAGIGMMALAAFAPFVLLRFVPVVEAALIAQGISHMPARVAQQGMQATYYGQGLARLAGSGAGAAGAAGGAAAGGGAPSGGPSGSGSSGTGPSGTGPSGGSPTGAGSTPGGGGSSGGTQGSAGGSESEPSPSPSGSSTSTTPRQSARSGGSVSRDSASTDSQSATPLPHGPPPSRQAGGDRSPSRNGGSSRSPGSASSPVVVPHGSAPATGSAAPPTEPRRTQSRGFTGTSL